MLVILFLTYLPESHELGTYKFESEVIPSNGKALSANSQLQGSRIKCHFVTAPCEKTLLLRNYPPAFLLTDSYTEACPDAV